MSEIDLDNLITSVAVQYGRDTAAFERAAASAAEAVVPRGSEQAAALLDYVEHPPRMCPEIEKMFTDVEWREACARGIIQILHACGGIGVDPLLGIVAAYAGNVGDLAVEALFQLASDGVETQHIVNGLVESMRIAGALWLIDQFVGYGFVTPELIDLVIENIDQFLADENEDGDQSAVILINQLISLAPSDALPYAPILREWVLRGMSYGPDAENYTESDAPIMEWIAISAALALHSLYPDDIPIREALAYWRDNHVNDEVRSMIAETLSAG
jgi:hypothetical protein